MTAILVRPPAAGPAGVPATWARRLDGYAWEKQAIGRSSAATYRLTADGRPDLFVKSEPSGLFCEIMGEAARLRWMRDHDLPCPEVLGLEGIAGSHWLLMSAVPGADLSRRGDRLPTEIIALAVDVLKRLHALPVDSCPFDHRLSRRLAAAKSRLAAGRVDGRNFSDAHHGKTAPALMDELLARRPKDADRVVTHGDASLPNFIATPAGFSGYVDCARLGVADRYQDIALMGSSIGFNLGVDWVEPFYRAYGLTSPDRDKIAFYLMLDEFF